MSLFYTFYGDADISSAELQKVIAAAVGGSVSSRNSIVCPGMNVTAHRVEFDDEDSTGRYFGFLERITATFNFDNLAGHELRQHNTALMVAAVLAILDNYPGQAVLLFNGEHAVLQRTDKEVVFDSDWEDWHEVDEVRPLISSHEMRKLPQPLL